MRALTRIHDAFRRLRTDEDGVTIVEGLVAVLLLAMGALGTLQVFDAGTRNTFRTEQSQVVNNMLQAELEQIRQLPYSKIALTSQPASSSNSNNPRWRVAGTRYATGREGTELKEMVFNGGSVPGGGQVSGGAVAPGPDSFTTGDVTGRIHRFVTWDSDPGCPQCGAGLMKRVIVAATIEGTGVVLERAFQEVHTQVADPEATPTSNPVPEGTDVASASAQFWLTDTPCNLNTRVPTSADHPTHNTRGLCSSGLKLDSTRGAPDLMFVEAPVLDPNYPPGAPPLYDYATDVEPPAGAPPDIGLQKVKPTGLTENCHMQPVLSVLNLRKALEGLLAPLAVGSTVAATDGLLDVVTSDTNKQMRMHTWLSPKISGSGGVLQGRGSLELFTKSVGAAAYRGEICATVFIRQKVQIPKCLLVSLLGVCLSIEYTEIEADIPVANVGALSNTNGVQCAQGLNLTYFRCSKDPWPTDWTKLTIPMDFVGVNAAGNVIPLTLPADSRIGMTLMVNKNGTNGGGLEFMYDVVGYESRLELQTNKILAF